MDQIVLDTNVIIKLFIEEEGSDIASKIKDAHIEGKIEIIVPSLTKYELLNALKYKKFKKDEVKEAMEVVKDYAFATLDPNELVINKIADFSADYDISAYDATYVALAQHIGAILYTTDEKMFLKVKMLGFVKRLNQFAINM